MQPRLPCTLPVVVSAPRHAQWNLFACLVAHSRNQRVVEADAASSYLKLASVEAQQRFREQLSALPQPTRLWTPGSRIAKGSVLVSEPHSVRLVEPTVDVIITYHRPPTPPPPPKPRTPTPPPAEDDDSEPEAEEVASPLSRQVCNLKCSAITVATGQRLPCSRPARVLAVKQGSRRSMRSRSPRKKATKKRAASSSKGRSKSPRKKGGRAKSKGKDKGKSKGKSKGGRSRSRKRK